MQKLLTSIVLVIHFTLSSMDHTDDIVSLETAEDLMILEKQTNSSPNTVDARNLTVDRIDPSTLWYIRKNYPNVKTFILPSNLKNKDDLIEYNYTHTLGIILVDAPISKSQQIPYLFNSSSDSSSNSAHEDL